MAKREKKWSGDFIDRVSRESGVPKPQVRKVVSAFLAAFSDSLAHGQLVAFKDIGTFQIKIGRGIKGKVLYRILELKPARRLMKSLRLYDFWTPTK